MRLYPWQRRMNMPEFDLPIRDAGTNLTAGLTSELATSESPQDVGQMTVGSFTPETNWAPPKASELVISKSDMPPVTVESLRNFRYMAPEQLLHDTLQRTESALWKTWRKKIRTMRENIFGAQELPRERIVRLGQGLLTSIP